MIENQTVEATTKRRPRWMLPLVALGIGVLLLGAGIGVLAVGYDRYANPGAAMTHTIEPGDQLLVAPHGDAAVHRGDIIVFDIPLSPKALKVSRVAGVGGDQISCCDGDGRVKVNGHAITEDYLRTGDPGDQGYATAPFEVKVPDGRVFVLGDWRGNAVDSRLFESIPLATVHGTVVARFSLLGGAKPIEPTSAFTTAGLPGVSTVDRMPVFAWWAAVVGLVGSVLAFVWVAVTGYRRATYADCLCGSSTTCGRAST